MRTEKITIYDKFQCIAGKCPTTCCQEWKISVDEDTLEKWKKMPATQAELGMEPETDKTLADYTTEKDETTVIHLNEHKECPFLNKDKLCRLVIEHGDQTLSETCQIFPRQKSCFEDFEVHALMAGCPAVIDLFKEQSQITVEETQPQINTDLLLNIRNQMMELVQNKDFTINEAMQIGFMLLTDYLEESEESIAKLTENWEERQAEKEQYEILKAIREMEFHKVYTFEECNELFLDLAENYRKEEIYKDYLEDAAELAEEYEDAPEDEIEEDIADFEKGFMQYDTLFRNYLAAELFANLYLPEFDLESMVMAFEWIAMEYAVIRHTIFLQWVLCREDDLPYEIVRDAIVIIARMTGYDEEDVREYLENSFESPIWDWGYLALITGE